MHDEEENNLQDAFDESFSNKNEKDNTDKKDIDDEDESIWNDEDDDDTVPEIPFNNEED